MNITFDSTYRPAWPAHMRDVVEPVFLARRASGLAVQFMRDTGERDEWQFTTIAQRDAFTANLGKPFAVSPCAS